MCLRSSDTRAHHTSGAMLTGHDKAFNFLSAEQACVTCTRGGRGLSCPELPHALTARAYCIPGCASRHQMQLCDCASDHATVQNPLAFSRGTNVAGCVC